MSQRLPRNYTPKHYDLFMHITAQYTHPFEASVTITFQKNEDSDKAYLNIYSNIEIKSITQNNTPLTYTTDYPLLIINRSPNSDQDISSYPITIDYTVTPITSEYQGFYPYNNCYFTKFEPNHAHRFLPCFDDPYVRSTFSVKIRIPSNLMGLSNMPIESTTSTDTETEIKFQQTPAMCTYLLALFVGDFGCITGATRRGTPVKFYGEKGREDLLKKFLDAAIYAVNWMEEKTHVEYELPVLQLLSHPGLKTGMENYGLIALRDYTRGGDEEYNTLIVMHEVSHLWFGDLVAVKWWDSVWLNEGFAQYIMYVIMRDSSDEYKDKALRIFVENDGLRCLQYFQDESIVVGEDEIDFNTRVLRSIIYIKGAFVLRMFSDIVGEEKFLKVCSNWLSEFKNKNGEVDEFIEVANKTLNEDFSDFFNTWLKEVGVPILMVEEVCDNDGQIVALKLSQKSVNEAIYQFKIPVLYQDGEELKRIDVLMKEKEKTVELKCEWALVNDEMAALCLPAYSKGMIEKLCLAKESGHVNDLNCMLIRTAAMYLRPYFDDGQEVFGIIDEHF